MRKSRQRKGESGKWEKVKTFLADISDLLNEKNYQKIYEKVPAFRQEKADRLKHREDQAQSVGAWYLWMKIQERHKIPQDAGQSFNLSHSGKYVLCSAGVSGERVGCDIECMRKYHERLAEKYFCSSEYERIRNADEAERTEMFYRYWVLKESFLKATRKGLVMGLNTSEIQIPKRGRSVFFKAAGRDPGSLLFKRISDRWSKDCGVLNESEF